MQYKTLAVTALAATVAAQNQGQGQGEAELASVISVLQTALPSSLVQEALTNSPAVSSQLASEFSAGETPGWFSSLPTAVQTYLIPVGAAATNNATSAIVSSHPTNSANSTGNSTLSRSMKSSTATLTSSSSTTTSSGSNSNGGSGGSNSENSSSSSSSSGGASLPTAMVGMGVAGFAGLVGVLAL